MGKIDDLANKINDAIDEVRDDITSPETKEKVHKFAYDAGKWVGHATEVVGEKVNSIIDDVNSGFNDGKKQ